MYCHKKLYHLDPNSIQYWNCRAFSSPHSNLQLSLRAALKGAYNMPLFKLVYNPRQFGENQLVHITMWFSCYLAPVCISWTLISFACISFPFSLFCLGQHRAAKSSCMFRNACGQHQPPFRTDCRERKARGVAALNTHLLLWINLWCSSGL